MKKAIIVLSLALGFLLLAGCSPAPEQQTGPIRETQDVGVLNSTSPVPADTSAEAPEVVFEVTGKNFAFTPAEITVNKGDRVKIIFTSEDGFHDWVLDEFNVRTKQMQSPSTEEVTFIADKAGTFEYYCSVGQHREMGMVGKFIVIDQTAANQSEHLGCQEGEVNADGRCIVAATNNRLLFDKDVDSSVDSRQVDNAGLKGVLVTPKAAGNYPGIIMIHEWWGLNDNIKYMAKLLASEGYNVFAIDLYDGEVAETSDQAGQLAGAVRENPQAAVTKMRAAADYLRNEANSTKLASLGWCFGGGQSLNLSLSRPLDATVIYYGQLTEDQEEIKNISGHVLGIFGEEDQSISVASVNAFEAALNQEGISNDIIIYPDVGHAFANPSGSNYAAAETVDAWDKTLAFLKANLK